MQLDPAYSVQENFLSLLTADRCTLSMVYCPSMTKIHPTAIIHPNAKIADEVEIGPYAFIDEGVTINKGVKIYANAYLTGWSEIGENTEIHIGAVIGNTPQDWSFKKETRSSVRIGRDNLIREYVTIHRSSKEGGSDRDWRT